MEKRRDGRPQHDPTADFLQEYLYNQCLSVIDSFMYSYFLNAFSVSFIVFVTV